MKIMIQIVKGIVDGAKRLCTPESGLKEEI